MQACIYEEYGDADVVKLAEVERPAVKPDELLVRVGASAVTTADWRLRASAFPKIFWLLGRVWLGLLRPRNQVLGMDFAGVVEQVGKNVTRFRVGDRVFGSTSPSSRGAHAQYLTIQESGALVHTPSTLSDEQAAAVPFGANSALAFLRDFAHLQAGQRVLIVGASGSVGVWAVQLARHFGAQITAVCSAANADLVRSLGAHTVLDYRAGSFTNTPATYDLIFDTIGATTFSISKAALTEHGTYLPLNNDLREMLQALLTAFSRGRKLKFGVSQNTRQSLETIVGLIEAGALKPVVDRVYPMARIVDAHRHVDSRHKRGSVIVSMAS